jgi:hypothetical protein
VYGRAAAKALEICSANGGVYNKAAQFVASMQGGGGDKAVPKVFIDTLAVLTDRAPFRSFGAPLHSGVRCFRSKLRFSADSFVPMQSPSTR